VVQDRFTPSLRPLNALLAVVIDHFVRARRFETFSVHQILQDFRINDVAWLKAGDPCQRVPPSEDIKRRELIQEVIYWLFDSILVPLLRVSCKRGAAT
jgi:telomerase reverse transcriptase